MKRDSGFAEVCFRSVYWTYEFRVWGGGSRLSATTPTRVEDPTLVPVCVIPICYSSVSVPVVPLSYKGEIRREPSPTQFRTKSFSHYRSLLTTGTRGCPVGTNNPTPPLSLLVRYTWDWRERKLSKEGYIVWGSYRNLNVKELVTTTDYKPSPSPLPPLPQPRSTRGISAYIFYVSVEVVNHLRSKLYKTFITKV